MSIFEVSKYDFPCYVISVLGKPVSLQSSRGRKKFLEYLKSEAKNQISESILSNDIEIEIIWASRTDNSNRPDVDNIIKPILDSLKAIAYEDDKQVRSVTSKIIDLNNPVVFEKGIEFTSELLMNDNDDNVVLIALYSDTRMKKMGGYESVKANILKNRLQIDIQ